MLKRLLVVVLLVVSFTSIILAQHDKPEFSSYGGIGQNEFDTIRPATFPWSTAFNWNCSTIPGVSAGTVGAMWFNGKYYLNRWNATYVYRYNSTGPAYAPSTMADSLTYVGSCRDLTTDGIFLYGGNASTTLYRFDPNTMATLKTFTLTGGSTRALAWDPNRKGFWNSNFGGNIFLHDTNGVLVRTITSTLAGKYGASFDTMPGQPASLWIWNQGTGSATNDLVRFDLATGNVLTTYVFTLTGSSVGIAGGMEICIVNQRKYLLCNYQNFALVAYNMFDIPVELTSFTWQAKDGNVFLKWATATETNNKGFEVQKKIGDAFVTIGYITGKGTTTEKQNYSFVDFNVKPGSYTYRLRQVDFDGKVEISNFVYVDVSAPSVYSLEQNYPNPFNPSTNISFSLASDSKVTLKVIDILGQEVATLVNGNLTSGIQNIKFDASGLQSGIYFAKLEAKGNDGSNFSSVKKMILTK